MRALPLLTLLALPLAAQEDAKRPGLFDPWEVEVRDLEIPRREGGPREALDAFLAAHAAHRDGDVPRAVAGYLAFLGMPGRRDLPERYRRTATGRVERIRRELEERYDDAVEVYRTDREAALAVLRPIADGYPGLPIGRAARVLIDTDTTRAAVVEAERRRDAGAPAEAARLLEEAVRAAPRSLYAYEAKTLLVELGGPDLFEPDERVADDGGPGARRARQADGDDEESTIEISGD